MTTNTLEKLVQQKARNTARLQEAFANNAGKQNEFIIEKCHALGNDIIAKTYQSTTLGHCIFIDISNNPEYCNLFERGMRIPAYRLAMLDAIDAQRATRNECPIETWVYGIFTEDAEGNEKNTYIMFDSYRPEDGIYRVESIDMSDFQQCIGKLNFEGKQLCREDYANIWVVLPSEDVYEHRNMAYNLAYHENCAGNS